MRFEEHEYRVKEMDGLQTITITKDALEEWRDHYLKVAREITGVETSLANNWKFGFYTGKADVLTEILKHFDEEE